MEVGRSRAIRSGLLCLARELILELEAQEGAIVARMSAVEEMAGMDILCSDKTGTLTLNQLSVDKATVLVTVPNMPCASFPVLLQNSNYLLLLSPKAPHMLWRKAHPSCWLAEWKRL